MEVCANNSCNQWNNTNEQEINEKWTELLYKLTPLLLTANLMVLMLGMGAASNFFDVWDIMKKPGKLIIGTTCQCILLPSLGFGLVLLLSSIPQQQALGIIIMSCSPAGALANFFTFWMNGDLALSIVLTAISGIMAFIVMPVNMWLFGHFFTEEDLIIPYENIAIGVAFVTVPCLLGMIIRHFKRRYAILLTKLTSVLGLLGVLTVGVLLALTHWPVLVSASHIVIIAASIFPLVQFLLPFLIGKTCCMSNKVCRTISICCSSQNFTVVMNLIVMSFTGGEARNDAIMFPILYLIFHKVEIFLLLTVFQIYKFAHRNDVTEEAVESVVDTKLLHKISFPNHTSFTSLLEDSNRQYEYLKQSRNQNLSAGTNLTPQEIYRMSDLSTSEYSDRHSERNSLFVEDCSEDCHPAHTSSTIRLTDLETRIATDVIHNNDPLYDMAPYTPIYVYNAHAGPMRRPGPPAHNVRYEFKTFGGDLQRNN